MAKTLIKPLPCPFCGKEPKINKGFSAPAGVGTAWSVYITCRTKSCFNPQLSTYTTGNTMEARNKLMRDTINKWNTRK